MHDEGVALHERELRAVPTLNGSGPRRATRLPCPIRRMRVTYRASSCGSTPSSCVVSLYANAVVVEVALDIALHRELRRCDEQEPHAS